MKPRWVAVLLLALSSPSVAAAAMDDALAGARSFAMGGAHRAIGTSNDTLFLNPAGMAVAKRYALELQYGYTEDDALNRFGFSAIDSKSGPIAGGFGFTHVSGRGNGVNHFVLAAAVPLSDALSFGVSLHHIRGDYNELFGPGSKGVSLFTGDVGVIATLFEGFNLAITYNNVVETSSASLTPPTLGFGAGASLGGLTLAADMTLATSGESDVTYHGGAEYFFADTFPVRLGFARERFPRADGTSAYQSLVSGGVGWVTQGGGIEIAYRRSLDSTHNFGLIGSLKIFL